MKKRSIFHHLLLFIFLTVSFQTKVCHSAQKKVFVVTGETSGDALGAWWLNKLKKDHTSLACEAIGGKNLQEQGAQLYKHFNTLTLGFVGMWKFLTHLPQRYRTNNEIANYILENEFTDVILVDCPLTNLMLAWKLKKKKPNLHITYIAPPELWIWGKWGIDWVLKTYCDSIVVIYPFEVKWYKKQGLQVEWYGYPYYEKFKTDLVKQQNKTDCIALLPGSRKSELQTMLPLFAQVARQLKNKHPKLDFILPVAQSFSFEHVKTELKKFNIADSITLIDGSNEKETHQELACCCVAITKPGTITLILSLLKIPAIITYRVPWLTYLFARSIIQVPYVGLPNLLLRKEICKELIQSDCTVKNIVNETEKLYKAYKNKTYFYTSKLNQLSALWDLLGKTRI
jgi:lipid-A-disaccharide synthase